MTVNLWSEPEHAQSYLEHRKRIPRRAEGYAALLEFDRAGESRRPRAHDQRIEGFGHSLLSTSL